MIDDDDLESIEPLRGKQSIFMQAACAAALQETGAKFSELAGTIALTRVARPDHPSLGRADAKLAELGDSLTGWLATWSATNGFRAPDDLAGH